MSTPARSRPPLRVFIMCNALHVYVRLQRRYGVLLQQLQLLLLLLLLPSVLPSPPYRMMLPLARPSRAFWKCTWRISSCL